MMDNPFVIFDFRLTIWKECALARGAAERAAIFDFRVTNDDLGR